MPPCDGRRGRRSPVTRQVCGYGVRGLHCHHAKLDLGWERYHSRYFLRVSSAISRRTCGVRSASYRASNH